jgi:multidrug efflux pump subunit AcrA (membrane-fusion protein)
VDELDIAQIALDQGALIAPEALDGQTLDGVVSRIAPTSTLIDGVVTYTVRVNIPESSTLPLRIGMTTTVEIVVGGLEAALVVPTEAIQREGSNEFVAVTSGVTLDGLTVIEGDLTEGLTVIIPQRSDVSTGSNLPFAGGN